MRVAILADSLDLQYAGIHQYTKQLINALAAFGSEHEYVIFRRGEGVKLRAGFEQKHVKSLVNSSAWRNLVSHPIQLRKYRFDAVFEPAHFGPFFLASGIKRITMVHDITPIIMPENHIFKSVMAQKLMLPHVLKRADLVLTNSKHTAQDVAAAFPNVQSRIKAIHFGYDSGFKKHIDPEIHERLDCSEPFFLSVGTIEPRKNLLTLLAAFEKYKTNGGKHGLIIAGKNGWKSKPFFDALNCHRYKSQIRYCGFVMQAELRHLYSTATALIYPSVYEGFGIPIIEAMACGCPVLASDVSSLPEVGGAAAEYFQPTNTDQLTALMHKLELHTHIRNEMIVRGLEHIKMFSWKAYVQQFETALSQTA